MDDILSETPETLWDDEWSDGEELPFISGCNPDENSHNLNFKLVSKREEPVQEEEYGQNFLLHHASGSESFHSNITNNSNDFDFTNSEKFVNGTCPPQQIEFNRGGPVNRRQEVRPYQRRSNERFIGRRYNSSRSRGNGNEHRRGIPPHLRNQVHRQNNYHDHDSTSRRGNFGQMNNSCGPPFRGRRPRLHRSNFSHPPVRSPQQQQEQQFNLPRQQFKNQFHHRNANR